MNEQETMRINEYLALTHNDNKEEITIKLQQRVIRGMLKTEKQFQDVVNQDVRMNEIPPEIGKLSPIKRIVEKISKSKILDEMASHYIISIVEVMITE